MDTVKFGEFLRDIRKNRLNITQQGLSTRLNAEGVGTLSISTISRLETGKEVNLDKDMFWAMCKVFAGHLTPEEVQRWASYRDFKLSVDELRRLFGNRYDNLEQFVSDEYICNPDETPDNATLLEPIRQINATQVTFRHRAITFIRGCLELLKITGYMLMHLKMPTTESTYRRTVRILREMAGDEVVARYLAQRHDELKKQLFISIVLIAIMVIGTEITHSDFFLILNIICAIFVVDSYTSIVTPELFYTGQLAK